MSFYGVGQTTIYSENFNSGIDYYPALATSTPWRIKTISGTSGNQWAVYYKPGALPNKSLNQYVTTTDLAYTTTAASNVVIYNDNTINATAYNFLELSFKWIAGGEAGNVNDYLIPVYSTDDGTTWNDVGSKLANSPSYPSYQTVTNLILPASGTSFKIGFRWVNNATAGDSKGPAIDDITIVGYVCTNPTIYSVTGGGSICANANVSIDLSGSQTGVNYQLKRNGANVGSVVTGTGSAISFPNQNTAGTYTVTASGTGYCPATMTGSTTITVNPIPTSVSAGSPPAAICSGGSANLTGTAVGAVSTINYINESFNGAGLPSGWTVSKSNANLFAGVAATNNAVGTANEISMNTGSVSASGTTYNARISFGPINTTGKTSVDLAFKTWLRRFSTSSGTITASVQTSTDGTNWNASSWSKTVSDPAYIASESITLNTTNGVGSSTFYISFFVTGRLYYLSGANFDDIVLSTTDNLPVTYLWSGGPISSGGTSATPVVTPTATTTYTMTATSGGCSVTSDVLVNVNTVAPGTASSNQTLCVGETPIDLTLAGSVGTIQWQESANNTLFTNISGETSTTLSGASMGPLLATSYFRALVSQGGCSATSNAVMISTPTAGTSLSTDGDQATCRVKDGNWIHFYNGGRLIVSLSCADDLGDVSVTSFVEGSPLSVAPCDEPTDPPTAVMARHWVIERDATSFPISEPIFIRLPFDNSEFGSLESAALANSNASDNLTSLSDLKLSKYAGPNNVDANPDNNCTSEGGDGTTEIFSQLESGNISSYASGFSATGKYVQFSVPGFSEFWLHGSSINSPLPIELTHFNAICENERVNISWSTASEKNSNYFVVQKSKNMQNWENVETVKAIVNASTVTSYQLFDALNGTETIYYRLKYVDQSGEIEFYAPVAASCENKEVFIAFPNPTEGLI